MSEWTVDTLKEYVDAAMRANGTAIDAALKSAEKAVSKAEVAAEKRYELLNELRTDVATKGQLDALEKLVSANADRITRIESHAKGGNAAWMYLVGAAAIFMPLVSIIVAIVAIVWK